MKLSAPMLALFAAACAPSLTAQARSSTPSADTARALPAALLRRVGEAVDGYRNGQTLYVVVGLRPPFEIRAITAARDSVRAFLADGYTVVPVYAAPDSGMTTMLLTTDPCPGRHKPDSWCPDTTISVSAYPVAAVKSITITIRTATDSTVRTYRPAELDAVFFTLSAIDKFAMPYYTWMYGPAYAARMREHYVAALRGR